jgi:hypothetical protein
MSRLRGSLIWLRNHAHALGFALLAASTLASLAGLAFIAQQTAQGGLLLLLIAIVFGYARA